MCGSRESSGKNSIEQLLGNFLQFVVGHSQNSSWVWAFIYGFERGLLVNDLNLQLLHMLRVNEKQCRPQKESCFMATQEL